jgi:hypothetical protein
MKVDVIAQMTTMLGLAAWATTSPGAARNIAESNTFLYRSNDSCQGKPRWLMRLVRSVTPSEPNVHTYATNHRRVHALQAVAIVAERLLQPGVDYL